MNSIESDQKKILNSIFFNEVSKLITKCLNHFKKKHPDLKNITETQIHDLLMEPPQFELGQAAFPCFSLAKIMKQNPNEIAHLFSHWILNHKSPNSLIQKTENQSGYLNFFVHFKFLGKKIFLKLKKGEFFELKKEKQKLNPQDLNLKSKSLLIEFSQPNTHKAIHVGHLRNLVLGEALARIKEYRGFKVQRVTYPGDFGTHVAKLIWYLNQIKEPLKSLEKRTPEWLGNQYYEVNRFLEKSESNETLKEKYKLEISKTLKNLQEQQEQALYDSKKKKFSKISPKQDPSYLMYLKTRQISIDHMKEIYRWFNVKFLKWYFESELDKPSRDYVLKKYKENLLIKSKGALGLDLSSEDLGFVLLLKSDGGGLYLTKDIVLLKKKFEDFNANLSIVVVDARQKHHFKQLFRVGDILGIAKKEQSLHISYESVVDEKENFISSRKKTGTEIKGLRDTMIQLVKKNHLSKYEGKWKEKKIQETANQIVISALKYGMLRVDPQSKVKFSKTQWLKLEGDTGPYIEYVYARCMSILDLLKEELRNPSQIKKSKNETILSNEKLKMYALEEKNLTFETLVEKELLYWISKFNDIIFKCSQFNKPNWLANYLFSGAKIFNRFYRDCRVLNAKDPFIKKTRISLVFSTSEVIKKGLFLLGIPDIHQM